MMHSAAGTTLIDNLFDPDNCKMDSAAINPCAVYNLRQNFEFVRDTFLSDAQARQIALSLAFDEEISVAYWDIHSLRVRVLNKILSNAIANTPEGGKVAIRICKSDDYTICIKVSDSGIPAACGERLFYDPSGSLYHTRLCVQAHKGSISIVDDAEFSGTTVKIDLPLYLLCMQ
jgi:signal transduction histidine kinase